MKTLFPPQQESHDSLLSALHSHGAALDSSDTGTGKTLKAVEIARSLGCNAFVVCPKVVVPSWRSAFEEQGVNVLEVINYEKLRTGNTPWVKRNRQSMEWSLPEGSLVIFDEVHKSKGVKSLNSKLLCSAKSQGFRVLMLSATAAKDPRDLKAIGYALGLHKLRDFWAWAKRFGVTFDTFGSAQFPDKSRGNLKKLNELIYPGRGHRLTREDMGDHFTQTSISTEGLDFGDSAKIEKLCADLEDELEVLDTRREGDGDKPIALTRILRLRQQIELLKVPDIVEMVNDEVDTGKHVAVFVNFSDTLDAIERRMKLPFVFIRGGQSSEERTSAIERFQSDEVPVILANIAAGGVGVSLHDVNGNHPRISLISPTYNAEDWSQTLGRIDRLGGMSESVQRVLVAARTIEEKVSSAMIKKSENISLLHEKPVLNSISSRMPTEEKAVSSEMKHAQFGPSSLKMFRKCPGYANRGGTNPAAEMGTRIHDALETGDWTALNDYEESLAQMCFNCVQSIIRSHMFEDCDHYNEIRLEMDLGGELSTFGTSDVLLVKGKEAVKIDYKTGVGKIDPAGQNFQAKAYTLGAFQKFPEIQTVDFYFVIPRRDEVLHHQFKREDTAELVEEIRNIILAAKETRKMFEDQARGKTSVEALLAVLSPTNLVCNYCARAGSCPAIISKALEVAKHQALDEFEELGLSGEGCDLSPEELARRKKLVPILEEFIRSTNSLVKKSMLEDGVEVPGFEVKERSGDRKITSAMAAYGLVKDQVPLDEFLEELKGVPVGAFEDLIAKHSKRGEKKKRVEEVMKQLYESGAVHHGEPIKLISAIK